LCPYFEGSSSGITLDVIYTIPQSLSLRMCATTISYSGSTGFKSWHYFWLSQNIFWGVL